MTTLSFLQKSINELIEKHGPDHEIAVFTISQEELQEYFLQGEEIAASENGDTTEIIPMSDEELIAAVRLLEENGHYRLWLPAMEAINQVLN